MSQHVLGFSGLKEITNVHPVFTHFPIALFPATLLYYLIGTFGRMPAFLMAGRVCLYLAAVSGVLTALTGLKARSTIKYNSAIGRMIKTHQNIGITIFAFSVILAAWSFFEKEGRPRGEILFLVALAFVNYLGLQNADIGSRMVYTQGAGVKLKEGRADVPEAVGSR